MNLKTKWVKAIAVFTHFVFMLISLWSCQELDCGCVQPPQTGTSFFYPILGTFIVYDVQEIQYSLTETPKVKNYQFKEVNASFFQDSDNKETLRIERYRRENETQKWTIDSIFTAKKEVDKALKTENNVTYVKMIFPIKEGVKWNGNLYNSLGNDFYEMKKVNQPFQINGQNFAKTLSVIQQNDSTLVDLKRRMEIYAEGIGLVYQEKTFVSYCNTVDCLGKGKIDFGMKYILKIKSYGKE
ncbi:hypothetical protein [Arcicella aurantiaca]|nr:hypothetical protein [Arcicella aurantiaca]